MAVQFEKIHDRSGNLIDFSRYVKMMYMLAIFLKTVIMYTG